MPLADFEFAYNGFTFGGAQPCGITQVDGLNPPEAKADVTEKVGADGAFVFARYLGPRTITIAGDMSSSPLETLINSWREAFKPQTTDLLLTFKLPGVNARAIKCRPTRRTYTVDLDYQLGIAYWTVEFVAGDPAIYDETGVTKLYDG